ncbi:MAG: DUF4126 domain-containing protein [Planctomycetaceae bacterium]|nr:DUF4126 domain-containing protein [Planctomycetaceae bacterium]
METRLNPAQTSERSKDSTRQLRGKRAQNDGHVVFGNWLAAACGFRIFLPMFVIATAQLVPMSDGFHWIETTPAILAFGVATGLEIGAYYFPWLDNLLDLFATPAAVAAGV